MVIDLNKAAVDEVAAAGAKVGSYKEIGASCDIVITILPNGATVQDVLFGKDGVAEGPTAGKVVCDMSSVTPVESQTCCSKLKEMGVGFVAGLTGFAIVLLLSLFQNVLPGLM